MSDILQRTIRIRPVIGGHDGPPRTMGERAQKSPRFRGLHAKLLLVWFGCAGKI
ncbi:hypothetical protein [Hydrogenophaga sp. IBVHS2]|uniref:hypothetical protein n=1 Tax=Hydrogenophaga sp. IBVHS2 TaxID=1985170 RepID=UPI0015C503B7|nr:hypothetical protein [Hydrogenophaga sp. IBVHS2]